MHTSLAANSGTAVKEWAPFELGTLFGHGVPCLQGVFLEYGDATDGFPAEHEALPDFLKQARPARRRDYLAGRRCAREALARLGIPNASPPAVGNGGRPEWPAGTVGSITHTEAFAGALVGWSRDFQAIGFDAQSWIPAARMGNVAAAVLSPTEQQMLHSHAAGSPERVFTGMFSAKESVMKWFGNGTGRSLDWLEIQIALPPVLDAPQLFSFSLPQVPGFNEATPGMGRFWFDDTRVYTLVAL